MLDIKFFRENLATVKANTAARGFTVDWVKLEALEAERRRLISQTEALRAQQNAANSATSKMDKKSEEFKDTIAQMKKLSEEVKTLQTQLTVVEADFQRLFLSIPNMTHPSVPAGKTPEENVEAATWGKVRYTEPHLKPHYDIAWFSKYIDFERGTKIAGAGFPVFMGQMAELVYALLNFYLEEDRKAGYIQVHPPIVVNAASATAVGMIPDKEAQMYHAPLDDFYLVPTAEACVTNLYRDEILDEAALPIKHCAYTPCFRREAGSYGKDVRGLNRLHQFDKVELLKWAHPDNSFEELETLRVDIEKLLQKLELGYRTLSMCTGDLGFTQAKKYDLEVWAAGQQRWLEVSSISCFTDFQSRRANTRYRTKDGKTAFVHTLNGSGLAFPRVLAAILENNLQPDGRVRIPTVLQKWTGFEFIGEATSAQPATK
jgi:seryl-tRNA synthetase